MDSSGPLVGTEFVLEVGTPAHGGFCLARHEGRVVFVRHAIPGERVKVVVTEDRGGSYLRADAIEVLDASPDRVTPPCPHAGPGRCGGCDWQHVTGARQRELKADVIIEQFRRLAHLDVADLFDGVEELPGGLLNWRTRVTYAVNRAGNPGLHRSRSTHVERIEACPLGVPGVGDSDVLSEKWPGVTGVTAAFGDDGAITVLAHRPGVGRQARGRRPPDRVEVVRGEQQLVHELDGREFLVDAAGFWQVHPAAAQTFSAALRRQLHPRAGEVVLDLYCGAGALTAMLAEAVGPSGRVVGIDGDRQAVADAERNLADLPWVQVRRGRVDAALVASLDVRADLVVLDPPRAGAGRELMAALIALDPRAIGYVACDPAALARDAAAAVEQGWQLASLHAFDAFPMTHHVECVAVFTAAGAPGTPGGFAA